MFPRRLSPLLFLFFASATFLNAQEESSYLSSVREILTSALDRAPGGKPAKIRAIVTYYKPGMRPDLMVQDNLGDGIYVSVTGAAPQFTRGDIVDITGTASQGPYAPVLHAQFITIAGHAECPQPSRIELASAATLRDGELIQVRGVVRSAEEDLSLDPPRLFIKLAVGGGIIRLWLLHFKPEDATRLVDAEVDATGVVQHLGTNRREPGVLRVLVMESADIKIIAPHPPDAFALQEQPLYDILQYAPDGPNPHRIHVSGTVTFQLPGDVIFITNKNVKVRVLSKQKTPLTPGDRIDVIGFPVMAGYFGQIEDAQYRLRDHGLSPIPLNEPLRPAQVNPADVECELVTMAGTVRDLFRSQGAEEILLESGKRRFTATLSGAFSKKPPIDSHVSVTGILETLPLGGREQMLGWSPEAFRIRLRSSADLKLLDHGPFWTLRTVSIALCATGILLLTGAAWSLLLRSRNRKLKLEVEARLRAENALQEANERLEVRVEERSQALAREIQARIEAEREMEVILRERSRLASELHDSLEQVLTSAAFQLQALNANLERQETRQRHMELARRLLLRARQEARRSIWDLRSSLLDQCGLAEALKKAVDEILDGAIPHELQLPTLQKGSSPLLDHHLLRITQEAVTNSVKHSGATQLLVKLAEIDGFLELTIYDNGRGFDPETAASPQDGHFGLTGVRERVSRLGGDLKITSAPGAGTRIVALVPHGDAPSLVAEDAYVPH